MSHLRNRRRWKQAGLSALVLLGSLPITARAEILSTNLSNATAGTETAAGDSWLAASFGTDAFLYHLDSITLSLANPLPGTAELDLYTDSGLQPGSLLGSLTAPSSYASSPTETTFTASNLTLAPNSTYWAVLKADSGSFDWAWTDDNSGSGAGFQDTWASSDDAGTIWFTYDSYPLQLGVSATAVPEPGALAFLVTSGTLGAGFLRRHRRRQAGARSELRARPAGVLRAMIQKEACIDKRG